jgi:hypothetical protein
LYVFATHQFTATRTESMQENSAQRLKWSGGMSAIFKGDHVFEFLPSEKAENQGGTTFVHYEDFGGMFAHTMRPDKKSGQANFEGFRAFNEDLKRRVETHQ